MLKDLSHIVINGYFPSITIKHVSTDVKDFIDIGQDRIRIKKN